MCFVLIAPSLLGLNSDLLRVALFPSPLLKKRLELCLYIQEFITPSKRKTSPVMGLQYANSTFYYTNSVCCSHTPPTGAKTLPMNTVHSADDVELSLEYLRIRLVESRKEQT